MKKQLSFLFIGFFVITSIFVLREWLLLNQIESSKSVIKLQINGQLDKASSLERVQQLSSSTLVYERYLEPIFTIANRLMWPPFRNSAMNDWKRTVHAKIDNISEEKRDSFAQNFKSEVERIRDIENPGLDRMRTIIEETEGMGTATQLAMALKSELEKAEEEFFNQDKETVDDLRSKGKEKIRALYAKIKTMNDVQLSEFLSSKAFVSNIQAQMVDQIMGINDPEIRRQAWDQFNKKILSILTRKHIQMAKYRHQEQERVRNKTSTVAQPMAEAFLKEANKYFPFEDKPEAIELEDEIDEVLSVEDYDPSRDLVMKP
jgi:hypothetical protein